ncbi:tachylectin-related carbohydrate-binding protein [Streptomyces tanashiensis]|uniref:tachylectin-related carbohydrate-binding protein n=1 Tax=Streptomyces tanashiensis TaxID=67367 RepID=UPI001671D8BE|nr:tachylectin-related carbohydrate-binding protein [Streptomyces tanashiensis]
MRAGLVLATALVAGIAPVALGGAAAAAAPAVNRAEATVEPGAVVQVGGRTKVWAGEEGAGTVRLRATLPAGVTGPVTATLGFAKPFSTWPGAGTTPDRVAARMDTTASVDGAAPVPLSWYMNEDYTNEPMAVDLPAVEAEATLDYAVTFDLSSRDSWFGSFDLSVTLKDAQGKVVSKGTAGVDTVLGTPEAGLRGAVHARDKDGVLWRYEATGSADGKLTPRKRVGGGWGQYTAIVPLGPATAAGRGDLVARDKDGVLWYYQGSGDPAAPFKPRVRVGGGWNVYTAIASNGYGRGLVARDKDGVLWNYVPGVESRFWPRVRVGGGWNTYTTISGYADGLVARDKAGVLWKYNDRRVAPSASKPFDARAKVGGGWNVYNTLAGTEDLGRWNGLDLLARTTDGEVYAYRGKPSGFGHVPTTRTKVGWNWDIYNAVI